MVAPLADRHWRRHGRVMIPLLAAAGLAAIAQFSVWLPTASDLARTFPAAAGGATAVGAVFGLAYAVGALVVGPLADRYGRRPVLLVSLLSLSAVTLVVSVSPTWPIHLGARFVQGLIAVAIPVAGLSWVATSLPPRRRALAAALLTAAWQGANQAGQAYGQVFASFGWRTVQSSLAVGYVLVALAVIEHMGDVRFIPTAGTVREVLGRALGLARLPSVVTCWLLAGLLQGSVFAMYVGLQHTIDPAILLRARLAGLAGVAVAPLLVVTVRARPAWLVVAGVGATVAGLLAQVLMLGSASVLAGSVLVGCGTTLALPPLVTMLTELAPGLEASALAVYGACLAVGATLGVQAPGWLPHTTGYPALAAAVAVVLSVGALGVAVTARSITARFTAAVTDP
jgi:YNFM family putative membrane transporter